MKSLTSYVNDKFDCDFSVEAFGKIAKHRLSRDTVFVTISTFKELFFQ